MEIEIVNAKSGKSFAKLTDLKPGTTIGSVKQQLEKIKHVGVDRQSLRSEARGRMLKDEETLQSTGVTNGGQLFYKDLGPQIPWKTVFLVEYAGPFFVYPIFYLRPALVYGAKAASEPKDLVVHLALACWSFHYAKRLLETLFVHRFSHATMPVRNIFKNSAYYWGFTAFVSYYVNHPLYTPPHFGIPQVAAGLAMFVIYELGNLSIHVALRNLRPEGTKERRIPKPTGNPFTKLFAFVSCPNYTYEAGAWLGFSIMTQTVPGLLFTFAGFYQMAIWAIGKHKAYKKEFKDYPKGRKAIIPFLL